MLRIDNLTYRIAGRLLLEGASAQLPERARIGFAGRNGTGKTTLFRLIAGEIQAEGGEIFLPRLTRLGRVEQEAPGGAQKLIDFVLAADEERTRLLNETETQSDPHRIAEIQTRLADIGAHGAPARAAAILSGLGFDEEAQQRALSEYSGGWRMRVALAAVLFAQPDWLLLDEPTNYLDLEGTMWLVDYLARYPASILVISHDRDILDEVCDHILHLDRSKLTLWRGNYSSFERQRREKQMLLEKAAKKQDDRRKHLQSFVDRFRAKATKARQAQSRLKLLEKMQTLDVITDDDVPPFRLPSPAKPLAPPIIAMEGVSAGYDGRAVLSKLNLTIADDDRIGLLGANGNGKSTFAKLVAGRLPAMSGVVRRSSRLDCGFFAQHQIDDLDPAGTALTHVGAVMKDATQAQVRARAAQLGFPVAKAETPVAQLSGGEKARLLMGLAAFHAPHLIIMDEPTNHLDIDSRVALIEAINAYEGAIILISHDRYLLEACADRLWLVANGTVKPFDGDMNDYSRFVLESARAQRDSARETRALSSGAEPTPARETPRDHGDMRKQALALKKQLTSVEQRMEKLTTLMQRIDEALASPDAFAKDAAKAGELARQRGELEKAIAAAEEEWLELTEQLEGAAG